MSDTSSVGGGGSGGGSGGGDGDGDEMAALGELICRLNPYTELKIPDATGLTTGEMELKMLPDPPGGPPSKFPVIANIELELASNYNAQWTFKGQTLNVKTAVRIPYRFAVCKNGKFAYWQTENLLIGFAGDQGGG